MQRKNEEFTKNIKAKEVITTLCKFLSALDVESVPTAEVFRRAKFNKPDAVQQLMCLLSSLLKKVFDPYCACAELTKRSTDTQLHFVKCALWQSGYGSWWVLQPQACESNLDIGSRDLLLAFGWLIASGNLLEALLRERFLQLDVLSSAAVGLPKELELDFNSCEEKDIRRLQWQYGKLKLQWRSLFTAQQEQAKLTDKLCYHTSSSPTCYPSTAYVSDPAALEKDIERIQSLNKILEAYLAWKNVEPMFWCWMDSVIDGYLSDGYPEGLGGVRPKEDVTQSCSYGDRARRSLKRLEKMLLKLQTKQQDTPDVSADTTGLNHRQKEEVEKKVTAQLQSFSLVNTPTATDRGFTPYFQKPQASGSRKGDSSHAQTPGTLQASSVLKELRNRKAILKWEIELLRQSCRDEILSKVNTLEGLVFISPFKR